MILVLIFAFCYAQKWSLTGDPFNKFERKRAKLSRETKKYLNNYARKGSSLCALRESDNQCCKWANLDCFGCNPVLLQLGYSCESQQSANRFSDSESSFEHRRDCFCDDYCVMFDDCCADHRDTCSHSFLTMEGKLLFIIILLWWLFKTVKRRFSHRFKPTLLNR